VCVAGSKSSGSLEKRAPAPYGVTAGAWRGHADKVAVARQYVERARSPKSADSGREFRGRDLGRVCCRAGEQALDAARPSGGWPGSMPTNHSPIGEHLTPIHRRVAVIVSVCAQSAATVHDGTHEMVIRMSTLECAVFFSPPRTAIMQWSSANGLTGVRRARRDELAFGGALDLSKASYRKFVSCGNFQLEFVTADYFFVWRAPRYFAATEEEKLHRPDASVSDRAGRTQTARQQAGAGYFITSQ